MDRHVAKSSRLNRPVLAGGSLCRCGIVIAIVLHHTTDFIGTLERRFYDYASTSTSRQPSDRIAVIAIDDRKHRQPGPLALVA